MSLDIFEYQNENNGYLFVLDSRWIFQSITPQISHQAAEIKIKAYRFGTPGTLTVALRALDSNGKPTGGDIVTGTIDADTFTTDTDGEEYTINITDHDLEVGTGYAIVLRATSGDASNMVVLLSKSPGQSFRLGAAGYSEDSGSTWTIEDKDIWFEVKGAENVISIDAFDAAGMEGETWLLLGGEILSEPEWDLERWFEYRVENSGDDFIEVAAGLGRVGKFYSLVTGLSPGTSYETRAYAKHAGKYAGQEEYYDTIVRDTLPTAPHNARITASGLNSLTLTWDKGEGSTVYTKVIRRKDRLPISPTDGEEVYYGTDSSFTDEELNPQTKYYYALWSYYYDYSGAYATLAAQTDDLPTSGTVTFYADERDGYLTEADGNYITAHDDSEADVVSDDLTVIAVGQMTGYNIHRGAVYFNTENLPLNIAISAAKVSLHNYHVYGSGYDIHLVRGDVTKQGLVAADYGNLKDETDSRGSLAAASIVEDAYNDFTLNEDGRNDIQGLGLTIFGLRSSRDISSTPPTGSEYATFHSCESDYKPKLVITYTQVEISPRTRIFIDWDADGDFADEDEEVSSDNLSLTFSLGRDKEFEESRTGIVQFRLHNYHDKYTPENAESPLYGLVTVGKRIKIIAEYNSKVYPLFTGKATDLNFHPHLSQQDVFVSCADGVHYLKRQRISTPYYKGIPAYEAVNNILDAANWDGPRRIMMDDSLIFGTAWKDISAWDAIKEIEKALFAFFYIDRDGAAVWEGAYYRSLEVPRDEQATFDEIKGITYDLSDRSVRNSIKVKYQERVLSDMPICVAQYRHPDLLTQGESFEIELTWEGWTEKISSVNAWGYTSWGRQSLSVEILEESMNSVRVKVTYEESAEPLRATVEVEVYAFMMEITECAQVREDEESIANFGKSDEVYDVRLSAAGYREASILADYVIYRCKDPHPEVTITLNHPDYIGHMLLRNISDRVRVVSTKLSIDKDYFIDFIEYHIDQGTLHSVRYGLSECNPQIFWKLGTDQLGISTRLAI